MTFHFPSLLSCRTNKQAPAKVEEVEAIKELRGRRANYRADGIQLLTTLLTQSTSLPAQIYLLNSFMKALREVCAF